MRIDGALTLATVSQRWPVLSVDANTATEIDLSGLTEFDSAGLACLTALKRQPPSPQWVQHDPAAAEQALDATRQPLKVLGASAKVLALASTYDVAGLFDFSGSTQG
jgi:STAS domain